MDKKAKRQKELYKTSMLIGLAMSCLSLFAVAAQKPNGLVIFLAMAGVIVCTVFAILGAEIIDAEYEEEENYNDAKYEFEENKKKAEFITLDAEKWGKNE